MTWNIEPEGVRRVLLAAGRQAEDFEKWAKLYGTSLGTAAENSGGFIGQALADFAEHHRDTFEDIVIQVGGSLEGAAKATKAYMKGQHEMALRAQRRATNAVEKTNAERSKKADQKRWEAAGEYWKKRGYGND